MDRINSRTKKRGNICSIQAAIRPRDTFSYLRLTKADKLICREAVKQNCAVQFSRSAIEYWLWRHGTSFRRQIRQADCYEPS